MALVQSEKWHGAGLTYFKLPEKDALLTKQWVERIRRKKLPKQVFLCEEHFAEDCFDKSLDLQNQFRIGKICIIPKPSLLN